MDNGWADAIRNAKTVNRIGRKTRRWLVLQYVVSLNIAIERLCQLVEKEKLKIRLFLHWSPCDDTLAKVIYGSNW